MTSHANQFINFVRRAASPFHAVAEVATMLEAENFIKLSEKKPWDLKAGGRYFYTRNASSIIVFEVGAQYKPGNGIKVIGAHTDSPNLKVKPVSKAKSQGYLQLGVQTYGGGLWHTWFDRDLTVAGRVIVSGKDGSVTQRLVHIDRPLCRVPTLAIHLNRGTGSDFKFNPETQLRPVLALELKEQLEGAKKEDEGDHHSALVALIAKEIGCEPDEITDFELSVCDHHPATIGGLNEEFIFAPRLDNLLSCYTALASLLESKESLASEGDVRMLAMFDHEEIGSQSAYGAASSLLDEAFARIPRALAGEGTSADYLDVCRRNSIILSMDMAHAIHPAYSEKHEDNHKPRMHKGVVVKTNANQRYATTAETHYLLRECARRNNVPLQDFVVRNDMGCGSTIGPIVSAKLGVRTIDIGIPQLSMHSIREMCGVDDVKHAVDLFNAFWKDFRAVDESFDVDA